MSVLEMEKHDEETAYALGIRAFQEGKGPDSVLGDAEMITLCRGCGQAGVKNLVGWFLKGYDAQRRVEGTRESILCGNRSASEAVQRSYDAARIDAGGAK